MSDKFDVVLRHELDAVAARRADLWAKDKPGSGGEQTTSPTPVTPVIPTGGTTQPSTSSSPPPPPETLTDEKALATQRKKALDRGLVGLAFSGGGIRSGSVSMGFLQGLAKLRLLRLFDYLSSVSGGGYAAAWRRVGQLEGAYRTSRSARPEPHIPGRIQPPHPECGRRMEVAHEPLDKEPEPSPRPRVQRLPDAVCGFYTVDS